MPGLTHRPRSRSSPKLIDTNIFLSFYHLTSEDLKELKKLVVTYTVSSSAAN